MPRYGFWLLAIVLLVQSETSSGQTPGNAPRIQARATAQVQITSGRKKNDWAYYEKEGAAEATISDSVPVSGPAPKTPTGLREVERTPALQPVKPSDKEAKTPQATESVPHSARDPRIVRRLRPTESTPSNHAKPTPQAEEANEPQSTPAAELPELEPIKPLDPKLIDLRDRLRATLQFYYRNRRLNSRENNHWEIMHAIVAFGVQTEIERSGRGGQPVNAISWECWNQPCRGERMLYRSGNTIRVRKGPRVQGHYGQFLKMLAVSGVSPEYPMQVDGVRYTVADLIESEKLTCYSGTELTFKLIALSYYLDDMEQTWKNTQGETWDIQRLIREELGKPILRNAACGGTHRLMGFSYAVRQRQRRGLPMTGEYVRAETFLNDYIRYTFGLQNNDGSFSTEWFRGRAASNDIDRRLQTTGHILEWLVYTVPEELLTHPRMVLATNYLTTLMANYRNKQWEIGPQGHALHALALYDRRVFREHELALEEREQLLRERQAQPKVAKPEVTEPKVTEPEVTEPEVTEPDSLKTPKVAQPQPKLTEPATEPELTQPEKPVTPQPTEATPKTGEPTPAEPKTGEPTPAEPKTGEPTPAVPESAKPKTGEPTPAEPKTGEPTPATPLEQAKEPAKPDDTASDGWKPAKPRIKSKPESETVKSEPETKSLEPTPAEPPVTRKVDEDGQPVAPKSPADDAKPEAGATAKPAAEKEEGGAKKSSEKPEESKKPTAKETVESAKKPAAKDEQSGKEAAKEPAKSEQEGAKEPAKEAETEPAKEGQKAPAVTQKPAGPTLIAPGNARR